MWGWFSLCISMIAHCEALINMEGRKFLLHGTVQILNAGGSKTYPDAALAWNMTTGRTYITRHGPRSERRWIQRITQCGTSTSTLEWEHDSLGEFLGVRDHLLNVLVRKTGRALLVALSLAETLTIPSASTSKVISIWGTLLGVGRLPTRLKLPSLLSRTSSHSPWKILISMAVWPLVAEHLGFLGGNGSVTVD